LLDLIRGQTPRRKSRFAWHPSETIPKLRDSVSALSHWQKANGVLIVLFVISLLVAAGAWRQHRRLLSDYRTHSQNPPSDGAGPDMPDVALADITRRDLFGRALPPAAAAPRASATPPAPAAPPPPPPPSLKELAAPYRLIGVINNGGAPQAILEDKKNQSTRYLSKGDSLDDGIRVEDVREGKIILILNDERLELSL
jgi:hypothetical protein